MKYPREVLETETTRILKVLDDEFEKSSLQWQDYCDLVMAAAAHYRTKQAPMPKPLDIK